jgi:hypothetical protein
MAVSLLMVEATMMVWMECLGLVDDPLVVWMVVAHPLASLFPDPVVLFAPDFAAELSPFVALSTIVRSIDQSIEVANVVKSIGPDFLALWGSTLWATTPWLDRLLTGVAVAF